MQNSKTISEAINNDYKSFALYTISNRALPCYIDGLKPVHRKLLYSMIKNFKGNNVKVAELAASIVSCGYHHGTQAAEGSVVGMTANWNNNLPIFKEDGAFGSRIITEAAASRYIFCSLHENFEKYFSDFDVLDYIDDEDTPEPKTYLPNIPWVLVNGINGIAVGFKVSILPHSPKDISELCLKYLKGKNIDKENLLPTFPKFTGKVEKIEDSKYKTIGEISRTGRNQWTITELPIGYDRSKYFDILKKLLDKGQIQDFEDNCSETFNFIIKVDTKQDKEISKDPISYFKLDQIHSEIYSTLNENNSLVIFNNKIEIIKTFIDYRIKKVQEQIEYDKNKLQILISYNNFKIRFINDVLSGVIDIKKLSRKELIEIIKNEYDNISDDEVNKLISIPIYSMTKDSINDIEKTLNSYTKDLKFLEKKTSINVLEERLKKIVGV